MATKEELLKRVAELESQHIALVNVRDDQKATLVALRKDLEAARADAALAKENLARALGYIDRINDAERPPQVPYVPPSTPSENRGPVLQSAAKPDMYGRLR